MLMRGDGGHMDTQTMKDYIEDLLIERNTLYSKIRELEFAVARLAQVSTSLLDMEDERG